MIPNQHYHKKWEGMVHTWFNQPARKVRRLRARQVKAAKIAPTPTHRLRPVVHCPTRRYNMRVRLGRGFTLDEVRKAGLHPTVAARLGIVVDHRRRNKSVESLQTNVQRIKEYRSKLIIFPRNLQKPAKGDSTEEERKVATQVKGTVMPIRKRGRVVRPHKITPEELAFQAFHTIRHARAARKRHGKRMLKAKAAEEN